ncbi:MaoC family dehydratase [Gluconacetobacter sp. Hr-1-5]|uniref:MaoC family dehydratase n=1 Tax=Gluconacetobacter sp. Hr-1-5 TaxID=3395370 RepID=UPI003B5223BD
MTETGKKLYLEDLTVGMEFRSSEYALDREKIVAFASEFDPQPFHLDDAAAENSSFNGLAASGWHTMSVTMRLLVESVPFGSGLIGAGAELSWPAPTRPDDVLHVWTEIIDIRPSRSKLDRGIVVIRSRTLNQHNELRQDVTAKILVFSREV